MRVMVTGASGMLGKDVVKTLSEDGSISIFPVDRASSKQKNEIVIDITDQKALSEALSKSDPDVIVHCAAFTDVDFCEKNKELTDKLHVEATRNLASYKPGSVRLIYISTDSVFDGKRGNYSEEDATNPKNYYAKSKFEGEKAALSTNKNTLVLRTNIFGFHKPAGRSLAEWAIDELSKGKKISGFYDVYFNPLYTKQLVRVINKLLGMNAINGIMNAAAGGSISKYDFLLKIAHAFGFPNSNIGKSSVDASGLGAERPKNTTLNTDKMKKLLNESPSISEGIGELAKDYRK